MSLISQEAVCQSSPSQSIQNLRDQWIQIEASQEQIRVKQLSQTFNEKLNGHQLNASSREKVAEFFSNNIGKTEFENFELAMQAYDEIILAGDVLFNKYKSFYTDLKNIPPDQLKLIFKGK